MDKRFIITEAENQIIIDRVAERFGYGMVYSSR